MRPPLTPTVEPDEDSGPPQGQMGPVPLLEVRSLLLWLVGRVSEVAVSGSLLFRYGTIGTLHGKFSTASS